MTAPDSEQGGENPPPVIDEPPVVLNPDPWIGELIERDRPVAPDWEYRIREGRGDG